MHKDDQQKRPVKELAQRRQHRGAASLEVEHDRQARTIRNNMNFYKRQIEELAQWRQHWGLRVWR